MARLTSEVLTTSGRLRGYWKKSSKGLSYLSFRGIPFAEPPTGKLRFALPKKKASWSGVLDAVKCGPDCPQFDQITRSVIGNEDCLYLNVYSRADATDMRLPVVVWIHGGAFSIGSGSDFLYGPQRAMNEPLVLVTINYRLGPLGFANSPDSNQLTPNLGLYDQRLAMEWTKENLASFGGDPDNITLAGESAGAASVHYHMMSGARGLFHKVILQSGTATCPWAIGDKDLSLDSLGLLQKTIKPNSSLDNVDVERIVKAGLKVSSSQGGIPKQAFAPVVDGKIVADDPVRMEAYDKSQPSNMPIMIGINKDEGAFMAAAFLQSKWVSNSLKDPKSEILGDMLYLPPKPNRSSKVTAIKQEVFRSDVIDESNAKVLSDAIGDVAFKLPFSKTLKSLKRNGNPTYAYHYSHKGEFGFPQMMGYSGDQDLGVSHFDEVLLQFTNKLLPPLNEDDSEMSERLWSAWSAFAHEGRPRLYGLDGEWPNISKSNLGSSDECPIVDINMKPSITSLETLCPRNKMAFWDSMVTENNMSKL